MATLARPPGPGLGTVSCKKRRLEVGYRVDLLRVAKTKEKNALDYGHENVISKSLFGENWCQKDE